MRRLSTRSRAGALLTSSRPAAILDAVNRETSEPARQPLPQQRVDADSSHFWSQAQRAKLVLRRCGACGRGHFPPRFACPYCWSQQLDWIEASGAATVYTFTVMHRAPSAYWAARTPYVVALVDLAEGPRMMANIVGERALDVAIGERVELCFEDRGGFTLPQFRRAHAS
jgi:uncharacterized OB-fold protein